MPMENFNILISKVIGTYDEEYFHMIHIRVTIINGTFPIRTAKEYVRVTDGVTTVPGFSANISGDQKHIIASFTTNAFEVFPGTVNIEFGYGGETMGVFENFNIHLNIQSLDPIMAGIIVLKADNDWLQTIS